MLKRRKKLTAKVLLLSICTSLIPITTALAGEAGVVKNDIISITQTTGAAVSVGKENTTSEVLNNELVNSSSSNESDFEFDKETGTVTGYRGTDTDVVIPNVINGIKVTAIGEEAFEECENLISITIPDSVTSIEDYVLEDCDSLEKINVNSNNKNYTSVDGVLFNKSKTKIIKYPGEKTGTTYTIPNTVTDIMEEAFEDCDTLISITIPDNVTNIDDYAISWCDDLQKINVSSNNKKYTSVDGVLFNKSKTKIIQYPGGKAGTAYAIPSTVTEIAGGAFGVTENLTDITIPDSVANIKDYAFEGSYGLQKIIVGNNNKSYASIDGVLFNKSKTKIIKYPEGKKETAYTIPSTVTEIIDGTFHEAENITSVTIPNSVVSIGEWAFSYCDKLTSIIVPESVTNIEEDSFVNCKKALFYVKNDKVKKLLINSGIDASKIILSGQSSTVSVTDIKLNNSSLNMVKGGTSVLTTTIFPSNASNKAVTWSSSNTKVATVDANGKITAVGPGTATITCTAKDGSKKNATCKVTVTNPVSVTGIKLNNVSLSMVKGSTSSLTATISPSNASNKGVTWSSSNAKVATVDVNGKITAVGAGTATITCTAKDGSKKTATSKVTVTNPVSVTGIELNNANLSIEKGKTSTLTATVSPGNASNKTLLWSSSNTKVATVDGNGKVTAVGAGTATITCTAKDGSKKSAASKVTVTNPVAVTSVKLNSTSLSMVKGKTSTLTAAVSPSTASNKAVTWSSSNSKVATVDSNGKIMAVGVGTANITCTAKDGSKKSTICKVTVTK